MAGSGADYGTPPVVAPPMSGFFRLLCVYFGSALGVTTRIGSSAKARYRRRHRRGMPRKLGKLDSGEAPITLLDQAGPRAAVTGAVRPKVWERLLVAPPAGAAWSQTAFAPHGRWRIVFRECVARARSHDVRHP